MLISENWLREWVNPKLNTQDLANTLTMAGLEVDNIQQQTPTFTKVVVGQVVSVDAHPDSNRLKVCMVFAGGSKKYQVVCGAKNVSAGMKVAFAKLGATLANEIKLSKSEIRGIESSGMICSAMELGLAEKSEGIMQLDNSANPGDCLAQHLQLGDQILELELTPNRGDCLSVLGVARELAALTGSNLKKSKIKTVTASTDIKIPLKVIAGDGCPRYVARVVSDINASALTPDWMKEKLRRAGIRPISSIVDITNFVMIEIGQPMHAFDLDNINKGIIVRYAAAGEKLTLLDDRQLKLKEDDLLICDHQGPVALAGIMGGLGSGISDSTTSVLLESAYFTQKLIIGKARRIGMQTDASYRFERGVDPFMQPLAIQRATQLIIEICGGKAGPVIEDADKRHILEKQPISLRLAQMNKVIGVKVKTKDAIRYLSKLGCEISSTKTILKVTPPAFRFDLEKEHDLIEEVARLYGYDRIPENRPVASVHGSDAGESRIENSRIRNLMIDRGYHETISYSFVDPALQNEFKDNDISIGLANPISQNLSEMRLTMLPGLLGSLLQNYLRQHRQIRLFELGNTYKIIKKQRVETYCLGAISTGLQRPEQWGVSTKSVDFYDLKSDFEALAMLAGEKDRFSFKPEPLPGFHPGRCAVILTGNQKIGFIGQLLPGIMNRLDIDQDVYAFQVSLDHVNNSAIPQYQTTSRFPSTRRDLSIIVDHKITANQVLETVKQSAGPNLIDLKLFDVYTGKPIDSLKKSISLGLTFQALERTLTEQEMDETCKGVMEQLKHNLNAELRI